MSEHSVEALDLFHDAAGPIEQFSWGHFIICGQEQSQSEAGRIGAGKDIRLIGQEVSRWKEREGHRLKKRMITGIYDKDITILVIGIGVEGAIEVPDKVKRDIEAHGIPTLIVERTPNACREYNKLYRAGKHVALLAHGTC